MLRLKFITSVSFDVSDADVIIHTSLFTYYIYLYISSDVFIILPFHLTTNVFSGLREIIAVCMYV